MFNAQMIDSDAIISTGTEKMLIDFGKSNIINKISTDSTIIGPSKSTREIKIYGAPNTPFNVFVLDNNDQPIDAATRLYEIAQSEWFYDKSNSNLDEFISFIPDDKLNLNATLDVNPNAVNDNFLHDESEFWIDIYA